MVFWSLNRLQTLYTVNAVDIYIPTTSFGVYSSRQIHVCQRKRPIFPYCYQLLEYIWNILRIMMTMIGMQPRVNRPWTLWIRRCHAAIATTTHSTLFHFRTAQLLTRHPCCSKASTSVSHRLIRLTPTAVLCAHQSWLCLLRTRSYHTWAAHLVGHLTGPQSSHLHRWRVSSIGMYVTKAIRVRNNDDRKSEKEWVKSRVLRWLQKACFYTGTVQMWHGALVQSCRCCL